MEIALQEAAGMASVGAAGQMILSRSSVRTSWMIWDLTSSEGQASSLAVCTREFTERGRIVLPAWLAVGVGGRLPRDSRARMVAKLIIMIVLI